ncbi:MAG TPA: hypothetical protein EYN70_04280 [Planctomycetaceae bacterium]|nr:hypothetical protein [Planctomycetaceae bacterium]
MIGQSFLIDPRYLRADFLEMLTVPLIVKSTLAAFLIIYILGWLRGIRGEKDPLLGGKVIYSMLFSVGFQLVLVGMALFMPAIMENNSGSQNGQQFRPAEEQVNPLVEPLALLVAGTMIGVYGLGMIYGLSRNGVGDSQVLRQALGLNAIVAGMISSLWFLDLSMLVSNDGLEFDDRQIDTTWVIMVYFIGHIFCALPVIRMFREESATTEPTASAEPAVPVPTIPVNSPDSSPAEGASPTEGASSGEGTGSGESD